MEKARLAPVSTEGGNQFLRLSSLPFLDLVLNGSLEIPIAHVYMISIPPHCIPALPHFCTQTFFGFTSLFPPEYFAYWSL